MDLFMAVIVVVSLISAESAGPTKVHKQLNLLETRVKTLETRFNLESDNTKEVSDHVSQINATLNELENVCQLASTSKKAEIEDAEIVPHASYPDTVERLLTAFNQEKKTLRSTADKINTLVDMQHNITKETDQNIQTLVNDCTDLKRDVHNINLTLIDLQDEMQQYIQSDKENTALLFAELISNKDRTAMLSTELKEMLSRLGLIEKAQKAISERKQYVTDMTTSINKKCPKLWSQLGLFCYRFFTSPESHSTAKKMCRDLGAFLVDIQNLSEQEFVKNLSSQIFWIGLTDTEREGSWKWDRTQSTPSYLNWYPKQPGNFGGREDCVHVNIYYGNGMWFDCDCSDWYKFSFVCKKPL